MQCGITVQLVATRCGIGHKGSDGRCATWEACGHLHHFLASQGHLFGHNGKRMLDMGDEGRTALVPTGFRHDTVMPLGQGLT